MSTSLAHRGPDHQAWHYDEENQVGLVHTRLSIIDLSPNSNQPIWDSTGRYCIVFNGEIYNYRELRADLVKKGYPFRTEGDGEVILYAYIDAGLASFQALNGIYAFAIWDKQTRETLLVRDPFGVKPVYFSKLGRGVVFASELKALLLSPDVSRELDHYALWQSLTFLWTPSPRTVLAHVQKLEPGHYLVIMDGAIKTHASYIEYPPFEPSYTGSLEDAKRTTLQLLEQAVDRQLVADVPVGAFLSGGVDSSALCHFAAKRRGSDLQCFTIELGGTKLEQEGMEEDLHFARRMAERLHVPLEVVHVTPQLAHDLPRMLFTLDEPQADAAPLNALYISQRAREMGIKVLLSGAGGDDVFSGYRRHYALTREPLWSWLPQPARHMLAAVGAHLPPSSQLMRRVGKAFTYADLDARQRLISYLYWIKPQQSLALFNPELRASLATRKVAEVMESALASGTAGSNPLNQMLYLEQKFFLIDHNFNYTDKTSMAAGVEVRVPFLDPDLVAFANRLPPKWKQHGADGKWILKQALESILPHDVLYRAKTGFGVPLRFWLQGPLRPLLEDILSETSIKARGIFDMKAVRDLMKADREGRMDATYTIFSLLCIEIWARQFIDPPAPQAGV